MNSNKKRSRLRLIRRTDRKRKGLPLRSDAGRPRSTSYHDPDAPQEDLDTPDEDMIGLVEFT